MFKVRSVSLKLIILAGLLSAAFLVIALSGVDTGGYVAAFLAVSGVAVLLWYFTRRPRPKGELPSASVSCCHYLKDDEEE